MHVIGVGEGDVDEAMAASWINIPTFEALNLAIRELPDHIGEAPSIVTTKRSLDGVDIVVKNCAGATAVQILYMVMKGRNELQKTAEMQLLGDSEFKYKVVAPLNTQVKIRARVIYDASTFRMTEWIKTSTAVERKDASIVKQEHLLRKAIADKRQLIEGFNVQDALLASDPSCGRYTQFESINRVRVALLGCTGTTKSSHIMTLVACVAQRLQQFRVVRDSPDCVSRELYIRPLENNASIELIDMWGYSGRRYASEVINALSAGHLPHLHRYDAPLRNSPFLISNPTISDMVHAVMLYISVSMMTDPTATNEFRQLYTELQRLGIYYYFSHM